MVTRTLITGLEFAFPGSGHSLHGVLWSCLLEHPGINFAKLHFSQKLVGLILFIQFWTIPPPKKKQHL
jgi:hypothetical protein